MSTEQQEVQQDEIVDGIDAEAQFPEDMKAEVPEQAPPQEQPPVEFDDSSHADGDLPAEVAQQEQAADEQVPAAEAASDTSGSEGPEWDGNLLSAAGVTAEQAAEQFGTPQALENAVRLLDQRFMLAGQQVIEQQNAQQQQQQVPQQFQQQAPPQATPPQAQPPADGTPGQQEAGFKMPELADGGEWDEDTLNLVQQLNSFHSNRQQQLLDQLQQQNQVLAQVLHDRNEEMRQAYVEEFDEFIEGLGDDWKGTFGEGSGYGMDQASQAFQNRLRLDNAAMQLAAGREAHNQPPLTPSELRAAALRVAFPQQQEQAVRNEVTEQVTRRQSMQTARPTARRSAPQSGDQKAAAYAEQWAKDRGLAVDQDDFDYDTI